jgi:hypothetical protein
MAMVMNLFGEDLSDMLMLDLLVSRHFLTRTDRKKLTSSLTYRSPQHNDNDMVHQSITDSAEMLLPLAPPT